MPSPDMKSNVRNLVRAGFVRIAIIVVLGLCLAATAAAQTESVLYNFANPPDGYGPQCNLVSDTAGNLYGTTNNGGVNNQGAVVMVTPTGTESVIYSFKSGTSDGHHPVAGLVRDKKTGILYGTTIFGGTTNNGTVFMLNPPTGVETVLYNFQGGVDGANPYSAVVRIGTTIFGTTYNGGQFGFGTVFSLASKGTETVIHDFNSAFPTLDGAHPYGGLVVRMGLLYGTTQLGGVGNLGTVFSITKTGGYVTLYNFKGGATDGQGPNAGVLFDTAGNIYGTTYSGGQSNAGTVYKISAGGGESILHHFERNTGDGTNPYSNLIKAKGSFYGTTLLGGSANGGTVYKITTSGTETVVHSFTGGADGFNPYGSLLLNTDKALYSTTQTGGSSNLGTVFKLIP
jgi:uncharacterized repeat protein (TIGR03803 family)